MRKNKTMALALSLLLTLILGVAGCVVKPGGGDTTIDETLSRGYLYQKQSDTLFKMFSSDDKLDAFLNDYTERHLRYNENAIDPMPIGAGNTIWKEWDTMASRYMSTAALGYDPMRTVRNWATNIYQDAFGYIWMDNGTDASSWGQGWEFPNTGNSGGRNKRYAFNDDGVNEGWASSSDKGDIGKVEGGCYTVEGDGINAVVFQTGEAITKMAETFHAPFVEINLNLLDKDTLGGTDLLQDITLSFTTQAEPNYSADKTVRYSDFASTQFDRLPGAACIVFPMYAHDKWGADNVVTGMKLEFTFKSSINVSLGINSLRLNYDARQINNNGLFLTSVKDYLEYTADVDFLRDNLEKCRRAMQFYLTYCAGDTGLISTKHFTGHDGSTQGTVGHGIGDGYWDIISYPQVSTYCNNVYYNAIRSMIWIERAAAENGVTAPMPSVSTFDRSGDVTYQQTQQSLDALLSKCREQYNATFWDESAGRYILGVNRNGDRVDYGFTLFNQEAVEFGIASAEQAKRIMDWIDGTRTVAGDTSQGEDIYFYSFAPRFNTKDNQDQYYWPASGKKYPFSKQVQNGGTAIHMAYYDLAATARVNGTESSFAKLQKIQSWYEDVQKAAGEGQNFYTAYYMPKWITDSRYRLQGGGPSSPHAGAGAIGLDTEFIEAAILTATIPDLYFGLRADTMGTLNITPSLPQNLTFWKMENLAYAGMVYDLSIGKNFVQINSIRGDNTGRKVCVTLPKPDQAYQVRQHNRILTQGTDYVEKDGQIVITVPFANGRIQVLEK